MLGTGVRSERISKRSGIGTCKNPFFCWGRRVNDEHIHLQDTLLLEVEGGPIYW